MCKKFDGGTQVKKSANRQMFIHHLFLKGEVDLPSTEIKSVLWNYSLSDL